MSPVKPILQLAVREHLLCGYFSFVQNCSLSRVHTQIFRLSKSLRTSGAGSFLRTNLNSMNCGLSSFINVVVSCKTLKTDASSASFVNPFIELQKYVCIPILNEQQAVFNPSDAEVLQAATIFHGTKGKSKHVKCIGSFTDGSMVPDLELPEVCFLGRSNVGKSSLLRCILEAHKDVKISVSKHPGHTKTINLYQVRHFLTLVDMPGYGHNMPSNFKDSVEKYLHTRKRLCRTFLLVDAEVGLTSSDHTALDMLSDFGISFVVVLTKIDKAGKHKLLRNVLSIMESCNQSAGHTCFSQPFLVSSKMGDGVLLLQTFIAYVTGCVQIKIL